MAHRIRRNSMEHLELYDLDKLTLNHQSPPPLPPPREHRQHLPPTFAFERYHFLCDMTRHNTDPVYAATPMFRTLPESIRVKHRRQILGCHIPLKIITPVSTTFLKSPEPESAGADNAGAEENSDDDDDDQDSDDDEDDEDDDDDGGGGQSSDESDSSSSSDGGNDDNDILGNDDKKGIVEEIFNRNKK